MTGRATRDEAAPSSARRKVIVVGAGIAGLTAAAQLDDAGYEVLIVERGRSAGGRLTTRQIGRAHLDIGAQFFTVRSPEFRTIVDAWMANGWVDEWCHGFGPEPDGHPRYRATDGMRSLAQHMARSTLRHGHVELATRSGVNAVIPSGGGFAVTYDHGARDPDEADAVVLAIPTPDALAVLQAGPVPIDLEVRQRLEAFTYNRVIAIMLLLDQPPGLPGPGGIQQPDDPTFTFIADNQAKGISPVPALTFHLSHALSEELWHADDSSMLARIHEELRRYTGSASVQDVQVRRWRHAGPHAPFEHRCDVLSEAPPLVLAGDAYAGAQVEGAFLSGLAAGRAVAAAHQPQS